MSGRILTKLKGPILTLAAVTVTTLGGVFYVHYDQAEQKQFMRRRVLREIEQEREERAAADEECEVCNMKQTRTVA